MEPVQSFPHKFLVIHEGTFGDFHFYQNLVQLQLVHHFHNAGYRVRHVKISPGYIYGYWHHWLTGCLSILQNFHGFTGYKAVQLP